MKRKKKKKHQQLFKVNIEEKSIQTSTKLTSQNSAEDLEVYSDAGWRLADCTTQVGNVDPNYSINSNSSICYTLYF